MYLLLVYLDINKNRDNMKNIKTWNDYCKANGDSMYFETNELRETSIIWKNNDVPIWMRSKWIAEYRISKLMPYYGGVITKEEWADEDLAKFVIRKVGENTIDCNITSECYHLLAFRSWEQRDEFLEHNEELVYNYLNVV